MSEEKVGFKFDFGIKGEKEVKRGLEDIFRLIGNVPNAAAAGAGIAKSLGGFFELGKAAGPISLAATALAVLGVKSVEAGENMRKAHFDIERLSRIQSSALSDSGLMEDQSALVEEFKRFGLEAGNTFQLSFLDQMKKAGTGIHDVIWDSWASVMNLAGLKIPSLESISPDALKAQNRVANDQTIGAHRVIVEEQKQQRLFHIEQQGRNDIADVYSGIWRSQISEPIYDQRTGRLVKSGGFTAGPRPESFAGRNRLLDIQQQVADNSKSALNPAIELAEKNLSDLRKAPVPYIPGTNMLDIKGRASQIKEDEAKINELLAQQAEYRQQSLEVEKERREILRDSAAGINAGNWRALGAGGFVTNWLGNKNLGDQALKTPGHGMHPLFGHGRIQHDLFGISGPVGIGSFHPGTMESVNVLKNIDSNISRLGIPTLRN